MSEAYCTFVMGSEALFDRELVESLKAMRLFHWYRSIWRVLHVDGFEPGFVSLPAHRGGSIRFTFETSKVVNPSAGGCQC